MAESMLTTVAHAERLRRRRDMTRLLLRVVPMVCGAVLAAAVVVYFAHLSLTPFWIVVATAIVVTAIAAWWGGRVSVVDDAKAAQLDADAGLGGELRSAHWFVTKGSDANAGTSNVQWTQHHVNIASGVVDTIVWTDVYPRLRAAKTWAGSAFMVMAAITLIIVPRLPQRAPNGVVVAKNADAAAAKAPQQISAEMQKQIEDLLKAVQSGQMPIDAARAKVSQLRNALSDMDPKTKEALEAAMKGKQPSAQNSEDLDPQMKALADKAEKAAAGKDLPQDMKWSLQDLADKLASGNKSKSEQAGEQGKQAGAPQSAEKTGAKELGDQAQQGGMQMTRSTGADAESNQVMTSNGPMDASMKVEARGALDAENKNRLGAPLNLAQLRKETIAADTDSQGSNVLSEARRKSEKSKSTIAFSRVAPLAQYDKTKTTAGPPTPDAMRPLVKQYFIRK